jgi:hypothetical protein
MNSQAPPREIVYTVATTGPQTEQMNVSGCTVMSAHVKCNHCMQLSHAIHCKRFVFVAFGCLHTTAKHVDDFCEAHNRLKITERYESALLWPIFSH